MAGSELFWTSGTWFFLIYGFLVLAGAFARSVYMERRYRQANPDGISPDDGGTAR